MRRPILTTLLLFSIPAIAQEQDRFPAAQVTQLDEIRQRSCEIVLPEGFDCGVLFAVGIPISDGMIVGIVGQEVRQVSVYLDRTLYTIAYDPALKQDDNFHLKRGLQVAVRIEKNDLILQWPDQTRFKGKIIRRESIFPNQPQPA